jgi:ferredoxin
VRIVADRTRCTSAGNCARVAPELFDQDLDDGIVVVLQSTPPESALAAAREAEGLCPANAIAVEED